MMVLVLVWAKVINVEHFPFEKLSNNILSLKSPHY